LEEFLIKIIKKIMCEQEIIHLNSQSIYLHTGELPIPFDSYEMGLFQSSNDPTTLGYIYIETVSERLYRVSQDGHWYGRE
jgi:hypothetical protein